MQVSQSELVVGREQRNSTRGLWQHAASIYGRHGSWCRKRRCLPAARPLTSHLSLAAPARSGTTSLAAYLKLHPAVDGLDGLHWHEVGSAAHVRSASASTVHEAAVTLGVKHGMPKLQLCQV